MKMKNAKLWLAVLLCINFVSAQPSNGVSDIPTPQKRATSVELAARLLKSPSAEELQVPDGLRNPFDPASEAKVEIKSGRPGSDKELLAILADQLHPTGVMGREDALVLLLKGQKSVKLNDKLTLFFDGAPYDVEVTAIDRNNFSLRFNHAEITRPIKPGKTP
jgi:hypothetical protein